MLLFMILSIPWENSSQHDVVRLSVSMVIVSRTYIPLSGLNLKGSYLSCGAYSRRQTDKSSCIK